MPVLFSIRLHDNAAVWRNAVAFICAGHELTLDWSTGAARRVR